MDEGSDGGQEPPSPVLSDANDVKFPEGRDLDGEEEIPVENDGVLFSDEEEIIKTKKKREQKRRVCIIDVTKFVTNS